MHLTPPTTPGRVLHLITLHDGQKVQLFPSASPRACADAIQFTDRKTAISRIWACIQGLGEPVTTNAGTPGSKPEPNADQPAKPKAQGKAEVGAGAAERVAKTTKKATAAKNAPKAKKVAKTPGAAARGRQDRPGGRHAATLGRYHHPRDHEDHGLTAAYRPRVHGGRDEEDRVRGRELQGRRR